MVKSFKSPEYSEFTNNWTTIDLVNDWVHTNYREGGQTFSASKGGINLYGDRLGYNSGVSWTQLTSRFDLRSERLFSFSATTTAKGNNSTSGGSHTSTLFLTDGTNSLTLISASANAANGYGTYSSASGFFTLNIEGNTVKIYRHAIGSNSSGASISIIEDAYTLNISTWTSLKIAMQVSGDAAGGYACAYGSCSMSLFPIFSSKKVLGSKKTLSIPA